MLGRSDVRAVSSAWASIITTTAPFRHRGGGIHLSVDVEEVLDHGEPLRVRAELPGNDHVALEALVADSQGRLLDAMRLRTREGAQQGRRRPAWPRCLPGNRSRCGSGSHTSHSVTTAVLAWPPESSFDADDLA